MYLPAHFDQQDPEELATLVKAYPLATMVTTDGEELVANHIPYLLTGPLVVGATLKGHVAKSNEVWQKADLTKDMLLVFQGSSAYITPNWYPSKQEHHQVVPTYNYVVVHVYGKLSIYHDRPSKLAIVDHLTQSMEKTRSSAWKVGDAPPDFIEKMLDAIVGVDVTVTRIQAKWKINQNRSATDREGVADGLERSALSDADKQMSDLVRWGQH
jgi:transcriptional regulator